MVVSYKDDGVAPGPGELEKEAYIDYIYMRRTVETVEAMRVGHGGRVLGRGIVRKE